jgi:hypothetical protein
MFLQKREEISRHAYNNIYGLEGSESLINYSELDWSIIVENYVQRFGHDRVFVLPFEALAKDPKQFLVLLQDWAQDEFHVSERTMRQGVDPNKVSIKKIWNLTQSRESRGEIVQELKKLKISRRVGTTSITDELSRQTFFALIEKNRKLQSFCSMDLEKFGYF